MYKILELLNKIPEDKRGHINLGMLTTLYFANHFWVAIPLLFTVAIGKEFIDWYTAKGTPELNDALATMLGGSIAYFLFNVIDFTLQYCGV